MLKTKVVLALAVLLAASAVATVLVLERRANDSEQAQLALANVKLELSRLQMAPFSANPRIGGSPVIARKRIDGGEASIRRLLATLDHESQPASIDQIQAPLKDMYAKLERIYVLGATGVGYEREADHLGFLSATDQDTILRLLDSASSQYDTRASAAQAKATVGTAAAILLLLAAFGFFYSRSARVTRSQKRALASKDEAQRALHAQQLQLRTALGELEVAQAERQRLLARTVEVAEHERIRVAIDLHDGPIQQLTAVTLNLDRVVGRMGRGEIDSAAELTLKVRDDLAREMAALRRLMAELRPPVLDERGLSAALNDCVEQIVDELSLECEVSSTIGDVALAPEIETVVYRVAREALINIRKHAQASRIEVLLEPIGDKLRLTVSDDGRGFPVETPGAPLANGDRYGLLGMRERIESVGGVLVVESSSTGVRIEATLPSKTRAVRAVDLEAA